MRGRENPGGSRRSRQIGTGARLARAAGFLLVACLGGCGRPAPPDDAGRPRHVLLVSVDTLRADHLGCLGHPLAATPRIDRLAREGVLFEQAHTPAPLTLPAHAALLTGTYPPRNRVRDNGLDRLAGDIPTLAEILRSRGFSTAAVVGSLVLDHRYGLDRGFETYADLSPPGPGAPARLERPADEVTDRALEWLSTQATERFFLWVHYYDPHQPYAPPRAWSLFYADEPYLGEIAYVDREIGRLLDGLDDQGRLDQTLVVLVADHGEGLGDHGELTHGVLTYESTLRVPMILAHPSLPAGARVGAPVSLVDVVPTVLSVLGLDPLASAQGESLAAAWSRGDWRRREPLYFETMLPFDSFGWSPLQGVIAGHRKLIEAPRAEVYDLAVDPEETRDLTARDAGIVAPLRRQLDRLHTAFAAADDHGEDSRTGERLSPDDRARLAALGYVPGAAGESGSGTRIDPRDRIETAERLLALVLATEQGRTEEARLGALAVLADQGETFLALAIAGLGTLARAQDLQASGQGAAARTALEEGAGYLERALGLNGCWVDLHHRLALALELLGRAAAAEAHWKRCLDIQPDFAPPWRRLGLIAQRRGDGTAAVRYYRRYLALDPGSGPVAEDTRRRLAALAGEAPGPQR